MNRRLLLASAILIAASTASLGSEALTEIIKRLDDRHVSLRGEGSIPWHAIRRFAGSVVYLCSSDTLSAAEIFSMAMMAMPNVTSLGESTVGALSDTHSVQLPNGWRVRMSNEVYKAIDGVVYEGAGIPVDIHLPPEDDSTLESYIGLGMDKPITLLLRSEGTGL